MNAMALAAALLLPLAASAEEPAAATPERPVQWKGTVAAGLIVLTGNSETTSFTGAAAASRETFGWILSAKATAGYGQNRSPDGGASQVAALNATSQVRLDRKFGEVWTVFVLGGAETDHVANVEYRTLAELGLSAQWLDLKEGEWQRLSLRFDLGLRYGYEARYLYFPPATVPVTPPGPQPGVELIAPRLGAAFRYGFSREVFFTEEAEVMPSLTGASRVQVKSVAKLSSRVTKAITFGVGYTVAFDSAPAEGKEKTDTVLSALLEVEF
jgi:putative salt-induced outer membrane protein YdiY